MFRSLLIFFFFSLIFKLSAQTQYLDALNLAKSFNDKEQYHEAIPILNDLIAENKNSYDAQYELSLCYFQTGNYDKTIEILNPIIKSCQHNLPEWMSSVILLGSVYNLNNQFLLTTQLFEKYKSEISYNYIVQHQWATAFFQMKDYENCQTHLERSITENSQYAESHILMGYLMLAKGHRIESILAFYSFLFYAPTDNRTSTVIDTIYSIWNSGFLVGGINPESANDKSCDSFYDYYQLMKKQQSLPFQMGTSEINIDILISNNYLFFQILNQQKPDCDGFWHLNYLHFFRKIVENHFEDAFAYRILSSAYPMAYENWKSKNESVYEKFSLWMKKI